MLERPESALEIDGGFAVRGTSDRLVAGLFAVAERAVPVLGRESVMGEALDVLVQPLRVHALDRLPEPSDIADAIAFLCSDQARAITGILLPIDAGWLAAVSYRTYAGGVPWKE